MSKLPINNKETLKALAVHIQKMSAYKEVTKMDIGNFGIVIGPNILRPEQETMETAMHSSFQQLLVERLVKNHDKVFK